MVATFDPAVDSAGAKTKAGESMTRATHTAIDGGTVVFDGPIDLSAPATSSMRFQDAGLVRELTTAPVVPSTPCRSSSTRPMPTRAANCASATVTRPTPGSRPGAATPPPCGGRRARPPAGPDRCARGGADRRVRPPHTHRNHDRPGGGRRRVGAGHHPPGQGAARRRPGRGGPARAEVAQGCPGGPAPRCGRRAVPRRGPSRRPVLILVGDTTSTTLLLDGDGREADEATTRAAELTVTWTAAG